MNESLNRNYYPGERRMIPPLERRIEVIYRRGADLPMIVIVLFLSIFITIPILASHIGKALHLAILFNVFWIALLAFFLIYQKRKLVRAFDAGSVIRRDGQRFAWSDFMGTITRYSSSRSMGKTIWRIELYFTNGQVWVSPSTMKNGKEVLDFAKSLPVVALKSAGTN